MSTFVITLAVALGFGVIVSRARSLALVLATAQSLLLAGVAVEHAIEDAGIAVAAGGLLLRAAAIAAILAVGIARTPDPRPVRAGIEPMTRALVALVSMVVIPPLVPELGVADARAQDAAVSLAVLGIVIALTRRATILQILGIVVAENGATMLALAATDRVPVIIELGVVFDLLLIAVVATTFHARIFGQFGSGDAGQLRGLHD
jgi:hydrogenase-4 component E